MVGIGRMTQPEHDGDRDDDRERRPVRRAGDPLVETEHHTTSIMSTTFRFT